MTRITLLLCSLLLCFSAAACEPGAGAADASAPPPDAAIDAGALADAFNGSALGTRACEEIVARAAECFPEYASSCAQDAFRAGCERVLIDSSRLRPIGLCVASGPCIDGVFETSCVDTIQRSAAPAPSIDSVLDVLCNACPTYAAGYVAGVSTPAECRAYVGAAVDGTGTSVFQRMLRDRYVLLTEEQLVEIRNCVAASPSCDAFGTEECGQRFRDLDMVLAPDLVVPECL